MDWLKVDITTTSEAVEALNEALLSVSPSGFVTTGEGALVTVTLYLSDTISPEDARAAIASGIERTRRAGVPVEPALIAISTISDEDWANNYKRFFTTLRIGRLVIRPSWEKAEIAPDEVVIELDPGLAFGTGSHPTTAGCLYFLQHVLEGGEKVFDLGTGSGILAIAAAKLGAARVIAIDNDAEAIHVARENARNNGVAAAIDFAVSDLADMAPLEADVLVVNLTAPLIIDLLPQFSDKLIGLKTVIFSGITGAQGDGVLEAARSHGYSIVEVKQDGDWMSVVGRRV